MGVSGGGRVWRKDRDRHGPALADAPAEELGLQHPLSNQQTGPKAASA